MASGNVGGARFVVGQVRLTTAIRTTMTRCYRSPGMSQMRRRVTQCSLFAHTVQTKDRSVKVGGREREDGTVTVLQRIKKAAPRGS